MGRQGGGVSGFFIENPTRAGGCLQERVGGAMGAGRVSAGKFGAGRALNLGSL